MVQLVGMAHGIESPAFDAAMVYRREKCVRTFEEDLQIHLVNGYVIATPEYFIMGRPVNKNADPIEIVNPCFPFSREEQNCWWIYLMAGNVKKCWDFYPYYLPFVGWQKKEKPICFYPMDQIHTRITK